MEYLSKGIMIISLFLLIGALIPVGILISQMRRSETRIKWIALSNFIVVAIIGYSIFTFGGVHLPVYYDFIMSTTFFLGSCFVWFATMISLQTANDIHRITQLEVENIIDPLMGIYNRRFLDKRIAEEITRATRYNLPLSVFMIDIDHFKSVNDMYGHTVGDIVLKNLGKLILGASRSSDIIARYGGEEICFIATNTPADEAGNTAERLCRLIESSTLITNADIQTLPAPNITVSIGVASLSSMPESNGNLLALADEAMYRAKHNGRNRVVVAWEPELAEVIEEANGMAVLAG